MKYLVLEFYWDSIKAAIALNCGLFVTRLPTRSEVGFPTVCSSLGHSLGACLIPVKDMGKSTLKPSY